MTRLIVLENTDPDRYGIDVEVMAVPDSTDDETILYHSGLEKPRMVKDLDIEDDEIEDLFANYLGTYRPFMG